MAALLAGLPLEVAGLTVNRLCGSGLQASSTRRARDRRGRRRAVHRRRRRADDAARRSSWPSRGEASRAATTTLYDTTLGWRFVNPRFAERHAPESMGETAENVAERRRHLARATRTRSRCAVAAARWAAAQAEGRFAEEIVPVEVPAGRRGTTMVERRRAPAPRDDDRDARQACARRSARAAPSPRATRRASTTAPRALVVAEESCARRDGLTPLARASSAAPSPASIPPSWASGPIPATRKAAGAHRPRRRRPRSRRAQRGVRRAGRWPSIRSSASTPSAST